MSPEKSAMGVTPFVHWVTLSLVMPLQKVSGTVSLIRSEAAEAKSCLGAWTAVGDTEIGTGQPGMMPFWV